MINNSYLSSNLFSIQSKIRLKIKKYKFKILVKKKKLNQNIAAKLNKAKLFNIMRILLKNKEIIQSNNKKCKIINNKMIKHQKKMKNLKMNVIQKKIYPTKNHNMKLKNFWNLNKLKNQNKKKKKR